MRASTSRLIQIAAGVAIIGAVFAMPAAAATRHRRVHRRIVHVVHRPSERLRLEETAAPPLTVTRQYYRPDPFHGPAAIITAPITLAGMIVSLPFRAIGAVFPAHGDPAANPLVFVGAPVHFAGEIAGAPFYAVDSAFGVPYSYD
jgi:hypothetical protein